MNKMLGLLAIAVSLAVGPAWAGDEFCDDRGGDPDPPGGEAAGTDPGGGSCEVNVAYVNAAINPLPNASPQAGVERVRDIGFSDTLLQRLTTAPGKVRIDWSILMAYLGADSATASEARLIEWSFRPTDKNTVERTLVLSLRREHGQVALMADWVAPPRVGWSYATVSGLEPIWLDHGSIVLGTSAQESFSNLHLTWTPGAVIVSRSGDGKGQELRFALPAANWKPMRLRNTILHGTALQDGTKVKFDWPVQFRLHWTAPPDIPQPLTPPQDPGLPPVPESSQS
ncbi:hypothetical protein [Lysobacter capsici]|uniref:hypothetical protein n=1 Tax=Lysobacter capsici TaxID=435897 RepID=UPI001BFFE1B0|nr:hypothetical protein [Lysobacter capsici]QWF16500.1 hypothetical protein KME82_22565 [Lysobacter capsici]